jgi:hypothetical protein
MQFAIFLIFAFEVFFTILDLLMTERGSKWEETHGESAESEFENFWLDIVQIVLALVVIYLLNRY